MSKVALVTGASRGIGKSIALNLAEAGFDVVVNYMINEEEAEEVVSLIKKMDRKSIAIKADIADVNETKHLTNTIINEFGRIDVLINNAGIMNRNNFEDSTEEIWENVININLKGQYFITKYVCEYMKTQKNGKIVNIGSIFADNPMNTSFEYGIAKAGVVNFTKNLAKVLGTYNINVNCVSPGRTSTDITGYSTNQEKRVMREKDIPLGRVNEPEDIAAAVVFLVSEDAKNITGQILTIDGGETL
ncbi:MAG: hypothetical protein A2Y24_06805 [Clostridiales bacterium GWE2_32_10]|nr:MAG: hypothetical protein A2Y24_06805 [Clostridiales bacterium GWE2_32_10]HBY19962.1 beta-ketoacyl-ACP reductase [Clostridiales bacterium]